MYIAAELTLIVYLMKEAKINNTLKTITCLIFVNIMTVFLFLQQERISEIISSFNNSFSDTNVEGDLTNWLAYRVLMLKNNIYGDFSTINIHYMKALVEGCPIAWMSSIYGLHIGLSIIVAEIILITTMLIYARKSRNAFMWIIATTFLLKGIIGSISNLFLMFSTNIGFPIVSNGYDLIIVMLYIINIQSRKVEGNIVCAPKEQSI